MTQPVLIPEIEELVPLPESAAEALPPLSQEEEIQMRARTIKLVSDLTGIPVVPTKEDIDAAEELAREMVVNPDKRIEYNAYPNETMAWLAGMITQSNCALVDDLSELKLYVVNKLLFEIERPENLTDSKTRLQALTKLGEVDGVDAFKKRSEVTVQVKPIEEVERELRDTLEQIKARKKIRSTGDIVDLKPEDYEIRDENASQTH